MHKAQRRYQILGVIGEGGYGKVYLACLETEGAQKNVALKLLSDEDPDGSQLRQLQDEAQILSRIQDRAVVTAEPPIRLGGRWGMLMEHVPGLSLRALLERHGALPPSVALRIVGEVARALDVVHNQPGPEGSPAGLLHRDIKPANVQLTPSGEVKLLDFGTAQSVITAQDALQEGVEGTGAYIAPERFDGIEGPEGDAYSLGVVLEELLLGPRRPERGPSDPDAADTPELREGLRLAQRLTERAPDARPNLGEVSQLCVQALEASGAGPSLRDWSQQHVPRQPELAFDDLTGTILHEEPLPSPVEPAPDPAVEADDSPSTVQALDALLPPSPEEPPAPLAPESQPVVIGLDGAVPDASPPEPGPPTPSSPGEPAPEVVSDEPPAQLLPPTQQPPGLQTAGVLGVLGVLGAGLAGLGALLLAGLAGLAVWTFAGLGAADPSLQDTPSRREHVGAPLGDPTEQDQEPRSDEATPAAGTTESVSTRVEPDVLMGLRRAALLSFHDRPDAFRVSLPLQMVAMPPHVVLFARQPGLASFVLEHRDGDREWLVEVRDDEAVETDGTILAAKPELLHLAPGEGAVCSFPQVVEETLVLDPDRAKVEEFDDSYYLQALEEGVVDVVFNLRNAKPRILALSSLTAPEGSKPPEGCEVPPEAALVVPSGGELVVPTERNANTLLVSNPAHLRVLRVEEDPHKVRLKALRPGLTTVVVSDGRRSPWIRKVLVQ